MIPVIPLVGVGRVAAVAVLLLLGDEGPLLIELDLGREGGKLRPTRRGPPGRDRRPCGCIGSRCRGERPRAARSGGPRSPRRCAPRRRGPSPGQVGMEQSGAVAIGESIATGPTAEEADRVALAVMTADREVFSVPDAMTGALGIQAAEAREVIYGPPPTTYHVPRTISCDSSSWSKNYQLRLLVMIGKDADLMQWVTDTTTAISITIMVISRGMLLRIARSIRRATRSANSSLLVGCSTPVGSSSPRPCPPSSAGDPDVMLQLLRRWSRRRPGPLCRAGGSCSGGTGSSSSRGRGRRGSRG